jgi:type II secretory pathway component GspD/PulD (secretin)
LACAQAPDTQAERRREVITLRHSTARELAAVLEEHFEGTAGVRIVPEAMSNALLVSAPTSLIEEVLRTVERLDRRPLRQVEIAVVVAEVVVPPAGADDGTPVFDPRELTGPADGLGAKLEGLKRQGRLGALQDVRLTAMEGHRATVQSREQRALVRAAAAGGRGDFARQSIEMRNLGTVVDVVPFLTTDGAVRLDLRIEESRLSSERPGGQDGAPIPAAEPVGVTLTTSLVVPAGRAVLASGLGDDSSPGRPRVAVVVTARVAESGGTGR